MSLDNPHIPLQGHIPFGATLTQQYRRMAGGLMLAPEGHERDARLERVNLGVLLTKPRKIVQQLGRNPTVSVLFAQMSGADWEKTWQVWAAEYPTTAEALLNAMQATGEDQADPPTLILYNGWYHVTRGDRVLLAAMHLGWDNINALTCRFRRNSLCRKTP